MGTRARLLVLALCGASLCVLLLACANLAGLLLARSAYRARELAVRTALGGARERLTRQLLTESVGLTLLGGAAGVALAALGVPLLAQLVPAGLPVAERPVLDGRVLAVALVVALATALLSGVVPAVRAAGTATFDALRDGERGGGRSRRLRATLVVVEVAASVVLLIASGLLVRAVWRIQAVDPGFRAEGVLAAQTALPYPQYASTERRAQFYRRVLQELRATPGVTSAAYASGLPMRMTGGIWKVVPSGAALPRQESHTVSLRFVTPGYFATLGIPLRRGRDVSERDTRGQPPAAVVSESFARRYWGDADPIGRRFAVAQGERTVVGVVGEVRVRGRERTSEPQVYLPYLQVEDSALVGYMPKELVVRTELPPAAVLPAVRRAVRAADPAQPVSDVATLEEVVGGETAPRVTQLRLLAILSAIALLVAGVGIHGLLTFAVTHRARELAVRRALGAPSRGLVAMVVGEGLALAAAGAAVGVAFAYPASRAMGALLFGVPPADPVTLAAVVALCAATAIAGCLRPALRATRVSPLAALRG
jgi:predicted permease